MIIKNAELETVCGITSALPGHDQPEFAFAGKSNVGKSSLINALMNRKALARTSSQPGKTQTINFYHVNDSFYYVDLPGYGYAKVSVEVKAKWGKMIERYLQKSPVLKCVFLLVDIRHDHYVDLPGYGYAKVSVEVKAKWGKMIERYLQKSPVLKCVFLLVDIRHDPSANDKTMYDWILHNGFEPVVIATKLDKIKRSQTDKQLKALRQGLGMGKDGRILPFSAETKQGREEIWQMIESFMEETDQDR